MPQKVADKIENTASQHTEPMDRWHTLQERIDAALRRVVPRSGAADQLHCPLRSAMRYSLLAEGKRFRGILCIESCLLAGGRMEDALPTACAIEMIHTMTLIHDDLPTLDNADMRRGRPANHRCFGESQAMLAGDALLALAFGWIAEQETQLPAEIILSVIRELSRLTTLDGLAEGQSLDLYIAASPRVDPETLLHIARMKTAALFRASAVCGARLGAASEDIVHHLARFGDELGVAYQLMDDVVDSQLWAGHPESRQPAAPDGLIRELGVSRTKKRAIIHYDAAMAALEEFGPAADPLRSLAGLAIGSQL